MTASESSWFLDSSETNWLWQWSCVEAVPLLAMVVPPSIRIMFTLESSLGSEDIIDMISMMVADEAFLGFGVSQSPQQHTVTAKADKSGQIFKTQQKDSAVNTSTMSCVRWHRLWVPILHALIWFQATEQWLLLKSSFPIEKRRAEKVWYFTFRSYYSGATHSCVKKAFWQNGWTLQDISTICSRELSFSRRRSFFVLVVNIFVFQRKKTSREFLEPLICEDFQAVLAAESANFGSGRFVCWHKPDNSKKGSRN